MGVRRITGPTDEPVTLAEAKAHARIPSDLTDDDAYVTMLIQAAREKVETLVTRPLLPQTWELTLAAFPHGGGYWSRDIRRMGIGPGWTPGGRLPIELPRTPVLSVESITYRDESGASQTLDPSRYALIPGEPAAVVPTFGQDWPGADAVTVEFVAGYPDAASVPGVAKLAMMQLVSLWYDRREPIVTGAVVAAIPYTVEAILDAIDWGAY